MGTSLTQAAPASHRITAEDRMERIGQLTTRQLTDALRSPKPSSPAPATGPGTPPRTAPPAAGILESS
jgi:hypothetical protein